MPKPVILNEVRHSEQSEESSLKVPMRPFASLRVTGGEAQGDGRGSAQGDGMGNSG
jgi:hypothetical protein